MTNEYIPIKDAINILENCKLDLVISDNDFPFNDLDPSRENSSSIPVKEIHALNIIKLAAKRWHRSDGTSHTNGYNLLHLYGKKSYNDTIFEKIYIDQFPTNRGEASIKDDTPWDYSKYNCNLFENYNYIDRYDDNINYTVLGHRKTDTINYYDISVSHDEFMEFINRTFKTESNDR